MNTTYFVDDRNGAVIRWDGLDDFEIYRIDEKRWDKLMPDNSYMREVYLGQGNNCMTKITKETADGLINENL